ncbi:MAG: MBL fold metallo-hydrolase [Caulobacterales bacterium]|nr:MBL fold metallo-hydrolase [Caulobacterales bacterium]
MSRLEITVLGCGSSGGVPRANGDWGTCNPDQSRNRRSRCSLAVRRHGDGGTTTVIVDTSPDLRNQTLASNIKNIDGVFLTHDHADQTHGLDDLRIFAQMGRHRVPVWMDAATQRTLGRRFGYVFEGEHGYPAICDAHQAAPGQTITVYGEGGPVEAMVFAQQHGPISSLGYRFGPVVYSSDVSGLDAAAFDVISGAELWILDALRWTRHPTHANVDQALAWVARSGVKRAVLTNLHIDLDYDCLRSLVPPGIDVAFDGWSETLSL